jgi:hypothetical protein
MLNHGNNTNNNIPKQLFKKKTKTYIFHTLKDKMEE